MFPRAYSKLGESQRKPISPFGVRKMELLDVDGWKCDCNPRKYARLLTVKKNGPNFGRKFYTCGKFPQETPCCFFLWKDQADKRTPKKPLHTPKQIPPQEKTPELPGTPIPDAITPVIDPIPKLRPTSDRDLPPSLPLSPKSAKRQMQLEDSTSESFDTSPSWELGGFGDDECDESPRKQRWIAVSTPSPEKAGSAPLKKQKLRSVAPGTTDEKSSPKLSIEIVDDGDIFITPIPVVPDTPPRAIGLPAEPRTPVSLKRKFGAVTPSWSRGAARDLVGDLAAVLTKGGVDFSGVEEELKRVCEKYCRQIDGVHAGRDIARKALANKLIEIIAMQARLEAMEAERKAFVEAMEELKERLRTANENVPGPTHWIEVEKEIERISELL
ncbi:DNA topoisomerase 3-alpha [Rhizina undulata]